MAENKLITEIIKIELNYIAENTESEGYKENKVFCGGIKRPEYMNELYIDFSEDEIFDQKQNDFVKTGKLQLTLGGSDRSLEELGKYLIALSRYATKDLDYHDHFDNLKDSQLENAVNLTIKKMNIK